MTQPARAMIVVPCFNEARRLDLAAIEAFGRGPGRAELLFVDDGSRDETLDLVKRLHAANPSRFGFLHLPKNNGKAEAVRQGVLLAIESGAQYVGFWDADLATPLDDIESFCRVLDDKPGIDLVIGTRIRLLGRAIERRRWRYVLGRLFANVGSLALGLRVFDTQCGAKLFRVTPRLACLFAQPFLTRWIFDVEILARMKLARRVLGARPLAESIYEFPLDRWRDVAGSTLKRGDFVKAVHELVRIYWTYLRPSAHCEWLSSPPPAVPRPHAPLAAARDAQRAA